MEISSGLFGLFPGLFLRGSIAWVTHYFDVVFLRTSGIAAASASIGRMRDFSGCFMVGLRLQLGEGRMKLN